MYLIADSGSTKTNWAFLSEGTVKTVATAGINLHYQSEEEVLEILKEVENQLPSSVSSIIFYGAGISSSEKSSLMEHLLQTIAPEARSIVVKSDLEGAAKALFGGESGFACILGTGASSGFFDGEKLIPQVPSLGFWLGDEGSGSDLGRRLIKAYLRKQLPSPIKFAFEEKYGSFDRSEVFRIIKENPTPNRYFGSFAPFISEHLKEPFMLNLAETAIEEFVINNLVGYAKTSPIGFIGSIAFNFSDILVKVTARYLDNEIVILRDPLPSLIEYHSK